MFKTLISTTMDLYLWHFWGFFWYLFKFILTNIFMKLFFHLTRQKKLARKIQLPNQDQRETTLGDFYLHHQGE